MTRKEYIYREVREMRCPSRWRMESLRESFDDIVALSHFPDGPIRIRSSFKASDVSVTDSNRAELNDIVARWWSLHQDPADIIPKYLSSGHPYSSGWYHVDRDRVEKVFNNYEEYEYTVRHNDGVIPQVVARVCVTVKLPS